MRPQAFSTAILSFLVLIMAVYFHFDRHFSGIDFLKIQIAELTAQLRAYALREALLEDQFSEYRQEVATLFPENLKSLPTDSHTYPLRRLASVSSRAFQEPLQIDTSRSLFERAKQDFRQKHFESAERKFLKIVQNFPYAVHIAEAYFLLAESQFQLKKETECIGTIGEMMELYPENILTGYSLLRLGVLFEKHERPEDAAEVYKTLQHFFSDVELQQQASLRLRAIRL